MISRCIALLSSLALAGCCASGVGCNATAPGGAVAWDGLGSAAVESTGNDDNARTDGKKVRQTAARASRAQPGDQWEQEQVSDQAADAKLTRQLKICSNC
jgi:hypothetical protein